MVDIELNEIYNYKELCKSIGEEPYKGGTQREAQEKRISSVYKLEKVKRKFKIIEIYSKPKKIVDNRGKEPKYYAQFKVPKEDWYKNGIYKIQFENKVYIGSTKNFRNRYKKHLREDKEELPHIWELLKEEEHTFEILEVVEDEEKLKTKEQYYIDLYLSSEYEVVNKYRAHGKKQDIRERRIIKVNSEDYEKVIELCRNNGIEIL